MLRELICQLGNWVARFCTPILGPSRPLPEATIISLSPQARVCLQEASSKCPVFKGVVVRAREAIGRSPPTLVSSDTSLYNAGFTTTDNRLLDKLMNGNIDHLRYIISRFDHYYDAVNNKGAFFLSINTLLAGGYFALLLEYGGSAFTLTWFLQFCLCACFVLCLLSVAVTIWAILPYTQSNVTGSNIFFGHVACLTSQEFHGSVSKESEGARFKDCIEQARFLACGLRLKFRLLSAAGKLLFVNVITTLALGASVLSNLN